MKVIAVGSATVRLWLVDHSYDHAMNKVCSQHFLMKNPEMQNYQNGVLGEESPTAGGKGVCNLVCVTRRFSRLFNKG